MDPARPDLVGMALLEYLRARLRATHLTYAESPHQIGRGADTYTYAFRLTGHGLADVWNRPLVVRVFPGRHQSPRVVREATVQQFVVESGLPAPRLLAVEPTDDALGQAFVVMEQAPGVTVSQRIAKGDLATVYRLAGAAADAHVAIHRASVDGWPLPYEGDSIDRQLAMYREWIDRLRELEEPLTWLEGHKSKVEHEEPAVCHNDFQPSNLVADDNDRVVVIDWSNADLGDRHQDIADALVATHTTLLTGQQTLLRRLVHRCGRTVFARRYLSRYRRQFPIERERLRYWEAQRAFARWGVLGALQLLGPEAVAMRPLPPDGATNAVQRALVARQRAHLYRYFRERMTA